MCTPRKIERGCDTPLTFFTHFTEHTLLKRYNLHGVLCDDMGLGKTLQTIAMLASDHKNRAVSGAAQMPSLVICPATLCAHWKYEILKV